MRDLIVKHFEDNNIEYGANPRNGGYVDDTFDNVEECIRGIFIDLLDKNIVELMNEFDENNSCFLSGCSNSEVMNRFKEYLIKNITK